MLNKFTLSLLSICATCYCANANDIGKLNSDEKVVATTGFEHSLKDEAHNVYVISSDEIAKKGYRNIKEALERVPGVSFVKKLDYGRLNSESIDMRGQGQKANSTVKLMINGVSINMLDISDFHHAFVPFEMIAIEDVERIEVVPGGGSVLYGSGTQGGVINIITKKTPREFYGSIKSEIGSYKYRDVSANVGGSITDELFLNFSSKVFNTKGYQRDEKDRGYYLRGSLNYQISDTRNFELSSSVYKNKFDYGKSLNKEQLSQDRRQNPYTYKQDFTKFDVMSNYQIALDNLTLNIKPYYQDIKIKVKEKQEYSSSGNTKALIEDEKIGLNFSTKFDYENGELITGYEMLKNSGKKNAEYTNSNYYGLNFYNFYKLTHSLYFMERHNFTSNFDLSAGARVEHAVYNMIIREAFIRNNSNANQLDDSKATRNNFALEIMPNFKYSDNGNLYFKFERGYNSPNPMQLVDKTIQGQIPVYKTSKLKSEIFNTYEIGLKDTLFDSIHIATALFYTKTKDEIVLKNYNHLNMDKTRRLGFEIDLKEEIFDGLKLTQSYSYINAKENSSQHDGYYSVPLVSKHKLAIGAIYEPVKNLSLFADMRYYSKQNYWDKFYNEQGIGVTTSEKSKSKTVVDVGANYEFNNGLSLGAGVNNLLNKKYFDYERKYNRGVINDPIDNPIGAYAPARERNFYARIKYEF